jgi:hypothetical protein
LNATAYTGSLNVILLVLLIRVKRGIIVPAATAPRRALLIIVFMAFNGRRTTRAILCLLLIRTRPARSSRALFLLFLVINTTAGRPRSRGLHTRLTIRRFVAVFLLIVFIVTTTARATA